MAEKTYHRDNLKSQLIEEGLKLLDREGYEEFSLRKVAKACNVSHTAPYRHFKNKDELIAAIGQEINRKFSNALLESVHQYPDDPKAQLKEMGYSYIKFFSENPEYLRLIFLSDIKQQMMKSLQISEECPIFNDENSNNPFRILSDAVTRYKTEIQDDTASSVDQDALTLYCWGLVHGIAILIARKDFPYQGDTLELVRKIMWNHSVLK